MKKRYFLCVACAIAIAFIACQDLKNEKRFIPSHASESGLPINDNYVPGSRVDTLGKSQADETHSSVKTENTIENAPRKLASHSSGENISTVRHLKKQLRSTLKNGDDDTGIAIGLFILLLLLSILILCLLIWLVAVAISSASNSTSNNNGSNSGGSGSGSNSGTSSGNGGGSSSGCYIATMVYGDYDAPEVKVLRRFRDERLAKTSAGRTFIKWYYEWSPEFVEQFSKVKWIHRVSRKLLDLLVQHLSR